jgi:hypothetical protein
MSQIHSKFQVFITEGPLTQGALDAFSGELRLATMDPKSVGVEFLEGQNKTVLSIGYAEHAGHPVVTLVQENLGKVELTTQAVAAALTTAAEKHSNVICHEFYVTGDGTFFAVLMLQA